MHQLTQDQAFNVPLEKNKFLVYLEENVRHSNRFFFSNKNL